MQEKLIEKYYMKIGEEVHKVKVLQGIFDKGVKDFYNNAFGVGINCIETDVGMEPMSVWEVGNNIEKIKISNYENCLCNIIVIWNDCINQILSHKLDEIFSGKVNLNENILKKYKAKISLGEILYNPKEVWIKYFLKDFDFMCYKDKLKTLQDIMEISINPSAKKQIIKVIEIRNSIQHHNSLVTNEMLRKIGTNELFIKDNKGGTLSFSEGSRIILTLSEIIYTQEKFYEIITLLDR